MIRVGLVGFGYWGPNLARNVQAAGMELAAVCDPTETNRERARLLYGSAKMARDASALFNDDTLDAIVVATPVATHYALARDAMQSGKHVFVEKPMAASLKDAEHLAELADEHRRVLMVDHTFVYTSAARKIRQLYDMGELGQIVYLDSVRTNLGLMQQDVDVVWDLAPHDLAIINYITHDKRCSAIQCVGNDALHGKATSAYLIVHMDRGLAGVHVSWMSPVKQRRMMIGGTSRLVVYDDIEPSEKVRVYDKGFDVDERTRRVDYRLGDMIAPKLAFGEALARAMEHFRDCMLLGTTCDTGPHAGVSVVRMLEAASWSMSHGGAKRQLLP